MRRKALIIEASKAEIQNDLPGARVDAERFSEFLLSDFGGAWDPPEITVMHTPNAAEVMQAKREMRAADYAFVAFSGHGYHVRGGGVDDTKICLRNGDEIDVLELNPATDRCFIIIDACRSLVHEEVEKGARLKKGAFMVEDMSRRYRFRQLFDQYVKVAEKGAIYAYACDVTESAQESKQGGYFSRALVECSDGWASNKPGTLDSVYDVNSAFSCAKISVNRKAPQQNPQFQPGRRHKFFPFAVWAL